MGGHKFSNPGHPFSCGITLAKLAAVTMDEQGNETFDTSGALDKLRKVSCFSFSCERLFKKIDFQVNQLVITCLEGQREIKYLYILIALLSMSIPVLCLVCDIVIPFSFYREVDFILP